MSGKRLIIDASVASSAGRKSELQSRCCRNFLLWVYKKQYHVIMSEDLCSEWNLHESKIAIKWRKAMKDKRRIHKICCSPDEDLRNAISSTQYVRDNEGVLQIVTDDAHLIELAFKSDKTIISLDDEVRDHLKTISKAVVCLRIIVWVNPTIDEEKPIEWLRKGARPEEHRKLGYTVQKKDLYRNGHRLRKVTKC